MNKLIIKRLFNPWGMGKKQLIFLNDKKLDEIGVGKQKSYILEDGDYKIKVNNSEELCFVARDGGTTKIRIRFHFLSYPMIFLPFGYVRWYFLGGRMLESYHDYMYFFLLPSFLICLYFLSLGRNKMITPIIE